jgi:predicted nucleic acid-binding protein
MRRAPLYLDSSALVKLVVREPESEPLARYLRGKRDLVASALTRAEVLRALLPLGAAAVARGRDVLDRVELVRVSDRVLTLAGALMPLELRSLDAIHLATARLVGDVRTIITYDDRMATAARAMKWIVAAPA